MKKLGLIIAAVAVAGSGIFAQKMTTYTDKKAKFSIQHPGNWNKKMNKDGINLILTSKDNLANVQVIKSDVEANTPAAAIITEVEKQSNGTLSNMVPEDKRSASPEDAKNMNVEEGSLGVYQYESDGKQINQMIMAMRKSTAMYMIIITFAGGPGDKYKDVVTKIGDSFKALK